MGMLRGILSVPHNIIMDLNNVMSVGLELHLLITKKRRLISGLGFEEMGVATQNTIFSVTYYLELHGVTSFDY